MEQLYKPRLHFFLPATHHAFRCASREILVPYLWKSVVPGGTIERSWWLTCYLVGVRGYWHISSHHVFRRCLARVLSEWRKQVSVKNYVVSPRSCFNDVFYSFCSGLVPSLNFDLKLTTDTTMLEVLWIRAWRTGSLRREDSKPPRQIIMDGRNSNDVIVTLGG